MGPGKGKTNNPKGKPKGTLNRTTKEARELFISIMNGEVENIKDALGKIRLKDPSRYIDSLAKLFQYTMPKQVDITSDSKAITDIKVTYIDRIEGDSGE
jgi:hypothetical protein